MYEEFLKGDIIHTYNAKAEVDFLIVCLAFVYDFNYNFALKYVLEHNYIDDMVKTISFENKDTENKMNKVTKLAREFAVNKLKEN